MRRLCGSIQVAQFQVFPHTAPSSFSLQVFYHQILCGSLCCPPRKWRSSQRHMWAPPSLNLRKLLHGCKKNDGLFINNNNRACRQLSPLYILRLHTLRWLGTCAWPFTWSRRFTVRGLSCSLPVVKVFILHYIRQIRTGGTTFYLGGPVKSVAYAAPA